MPSQGLVECILQVDQLHLPQILEIGLEKLDFHSQPRYHIDATNTRNRSFHHSY